jgi:hypothetical protein
VEFCRFEKRAQEEDELGGIFVEPRERSKTAHGGASQFVPYRPIHLGRNLPLFFASTEIENSPNSYEFVYNIINIITFLTRNCV